MLRWALILAGLGSAVWLAMAVVMFLTQARLVYRPTRELFATPADAGLPYEDLRLASGAETIHAWFVPAGPERPLGTVLFCHGNGGNLSHRVETLRILHGLGMNTLVFDYRGYGESTGSPSEQATREDALACWNWLRRERGEAAGRVVLMGRSLGGAVAARLAADLAEEGESPAGLVLESTFTSIPDMGAHLYPWLPVRTLSRFGYDSAALVRSLSLPVLVAHSPDDDMVPFALGRALFEAAREPKSFLPMRGDHNSGFLETGEAYVHGVERFFHQALTR